MIKPEGNLLIIDDNQDVLDALSLFIENDFEKVHYLRNPNLILENLKKNNIDIVLLDMNYSAGINSGNEGLYWLREILKFDSDITVVPITAYGEVETAVKALKEGAFDFVLKPWDNDKLLSTLKAAFKLRKSKQKVNKLKVKNKILIEESNKKYPELIGSSEVMKKIHKLINKVSVTHANILILGENGTGKELVAREIYKKSNRKNEVFIPVDLGSLNESLFETELFGHEKGAFTDAKEKKVGRFEATNKGTIFLDEIANIPLSLQAKLLSVIQNKEVYKVGSSKPTPIDVRLICATNKNLEEMVNEGLFREDLFYRINSIVIDLPPLRNRDKDLFLLSEFFVTKYANNYNKKNLRITQRALEKLKTHNWPGNIRELEHTIEKAVILSESNLINEDDFIFRKSESNFFDRNRALTLEEIEKDVIITVLEKHKGNLSEASKELAISRQTMYNKLSKFGI
ncbi:MAG: sigma-54 dependent transcriptional regulator [Bacteroidales bacterium]|jgi:DNA-binding NtrC family response regulator|nr:sigma-54 dependent transcriptional regulator [Bacteroidales bacterium]